MGTTVLHLVDEARPDPFQPDRSRELMVSVFYPAADVGKHPRAHYASTEFVPGLEQRLGVALPGLLTNSYTNAPALADSAHPVVLYSPGGGVSRVLGTGLAEDLASRGYVVVTIDHTYEASPAVEFPGGRVVQPAPAPEGFGKDLRKKYVAARLLDTRFVLDSLTELTQGVNPDAEQRELPRGLDRALDLDQVGMVGHSSGGYTAVESMHGDRRIDAAVDLDGQIGVDEDFGRAATEGVDRPVLVMTSQQIKEVGDAKPSLDALWQHATGWKREVTMRDSAHYDFTDMSVLVPAAIRPAAARYIGPIAAERSTTLVRTYVAAMFDKFLRDRSGTVLDRPPAEPEITMER
ncbi:alpha/beta hydrolase family protein [Rhodococcus sp. NPDC058514]|uniref:alpha/beta hydrolase family protein n=1 Tax=unclassified Rhodococcus (in: high G+C Gram-positive bacteria) TaxID=192944 RepID=UPI00364D1700